MRRALNMIPRKPTGRVVGSPGVITRKRLLSALPGSWESVLIPGANGPVRGYIAGQTGDLKPSTIGSYKIERLAAIDAGGGNFAVDLQLSPIAGITLTDIWVQFDATPVVPMTWTGSDFSSTVAVTWATQFNYLNTNIGLPVAVVITDAAP